MEVARQVEGVEADQEVVVLCWVDEERLTIKYQWLPMVIHEEVTHPNVQLALFDTLKNFPSGSG